MLVNNIFCVLNDLFYYIIEHNFDDFAAFGFGKSFIETLDSLATSTVSIFIPVGILLRIKDPLSFTPFSFGITADSGISPTATPINLYVENAP